MSLCLLPRRQADPLFGRAEIALARLLTISAFVCLTLCSWIPEHACVGHTCYEE
jgi:hypothetical protein